MQTDLQALQREIEELQTKLAFTEMTVEELNQEVIRLNDLVSRQTYTLELVVNKLKAMEPSNIASESEETPPPHY